MLCFHVARCIPKPYLVGYFFIRYVRSSFIYFLQNQFVEEVLGSQIEG